MKFIPKSIIAKILVFPLYAVGSFLILTVVLGLSGVLDEKTQSVSTASTAPVAVTKPAVVAPVKSQLSGNKKLCDAARHAHAPYEKALDANMRGKMSDTDFIDTTEKIGSDIFWLATDANAPTGSIDDNIAQAGVRWMNLTVLIKEGKDSKYISSRVAEGIVLWDSAAKECASIGH